MRKSVFLAVILTFLPLFAAAQTTTLTTVQDSASVKAIYLTLAVVDENGQAGQIIVDNRYAAFGPIGGLSISAVEFSGSARGVYVGFGNNPNGTRADFDSTATYTGSGFDVNGVPFSATGTFPFHAHYVNICAPRSPTCGWHYSIKAGSTVEVN